MDGRSRERVGVALRVVLRYQLGLARRTVQDKIFLPILGEPYGRVLEKGELKISYEQSGFFLNYYAHRLPIAPVSYARILKPDSEPLLADSRVLPAAGIARHAAAADCDGMGSAGEPVPRKGRDQTTAVGAAYRSHESIREHVQRTISMRMTEGRTR